MKFNKYLKLFLLLGVSLLLSAFTYSYWQGQLVLPKENLEYTDDMRIGEGQSVETEFNHHMIRMSETLPLVPKSKFISGSNLKEIHYTARLSWDSVPKVHPDTQGTAHVSVDFNPKTATGETLSRDIFDFVIIKGGQIVESNTPLAIELNQNPIDIDLYISIKEGLSAKDYHKIRNQTISNTISFNMSLQE